MARAARRARACSGERGGDGGGRRDQQPAKGQGRDDGARDTLPSLVVGAGAGMEPRFDATTGDARRGVTQVYRFEMVRGVVILCYRVQATVHTACDTTSFPAWSATTAVCPPRASPSSRARSFLQRACRGRRT